MTQEKPTPSTVAIASSPHPWHCAVSSNSMGLAVIAVRDDVMRYYGNCANTAL